MDNLTIPDVGEGPFAVLNEQEENGLYWLTKDGEKTGKSYPIGKTAYRAARQQNEAWQAIKSGDAPKAPAIPAPQAPKPKTKESAPKERDPKARKPALKAAPKPEPKAEPKRKPDPALAMFNGTREEWLNAFVAAARPEFEKRGFKLPEKVRVSVGFTGSRGGKKVLGACWHESASADGTREIFVVPTLDDSSRIADIVTHELCHTLFGPDEKHGKNFKAAAYGVGLEGKATATTAGDGWREWANPILEALGAIPHAALDPSQSGQKKQTTRLIKCECEDCGFVFRTTAKWINGRVFRCPDEDCGGPVKVEISEGGEGE